MDAHFLPQSKAAGTFFPLLRGLKQIDRFSDVSWPEMKEKGYIYAQALSVIGISNNTSKHLGGTPRQELFLPHTRAGGRAHSEVIHFILLPLSLFA